ncbi:hypothetical protein [Ulvibacter antarcticus]|uniref:Outer membrane protein n=1 Tax=Ulvibacter antarcticus TaxID=442714 RepID=A0A3L9Z1T3_9FLAO|nr:hypothetical protein [Ulvibacter antarcticus]RMA64245.1 hypothetical protein BXY75_1118 [Ulvibacter antarcticus]
MKNRFLLLLVISVFASEMYAQEISKNAIGVRFGDSRGFGVEANYQRAVGTNNNRIELGLATRSGKKTDAIKLTGLYEWVWNIDGGLNWYAGPGVGVGQVIYDDKHFNDRSAEVYGYATGTVGLEYDFDFPLLVSFDLRPEANFGRYVDDVNLNIGIAARYQF